MLKLLIFGSLFLAAHAYVRLQTYAPKLDGRIVGGTPIDISEARYQVALLLDLSEVGIFIQSCGGAIINDSAIVSAAHCLDGTTARQWQVRAGSTFSGSGGQIRTVSKIVMHPGFDSNNLDFDISLLFLSTPLTIDGITTYYVPLPVQAIEVDDGASAIATGWGATQEGGSSATTLMKVTIPIVNLTICENAYANINPVTDRMICAGNIEAGGQDACLGDSGGPLTVDGVLIGITSWGYGCARPGYPGVWTRVPYFRNWIDLELESKK